VRVSATTHSLGIDIVIVTAIIMISYNRHRSSGGSHGLSLRVVRPHIVYIGFL